MSSEEYIYNVKQAQEEEIAAGCSILEQLYIHNN